MITALQDYTIEGVTTNIPFLVDILRSPGFIHGNVDTHFVDAFVSHWTQESPPRNDPYSPWHPATSSQTDSIAGQSSSSTASPRTGRRRAKPAGSLIAPMPGRVVKVLVEEGDSVEAGDTLLVMEAMKMENAIKAPEAGTVTKLNYKVGDMVEMGKKIAEVE